MRALVLDADARAAYAIGLMLKGCDVAVDWAATAKQGLNLARRFTYDLLLTDLLLPDMSGRQLVQRLRGVCVACPIVVISRLDQAQARTVAIEAGANGFIAKPFGRAELVGRIQNLLPAIKRARSQAGASGSGRSQAPIVTAATSGTLSDSTLRHFASLPRHLHAPAAHFA